MNQGQIVKSGKRIEWERPLKFNSRAASSLQNPFREDGWFVWNKRNDSWTHIDYGDDNDGEEWKKGGAA